MSSVEIVTNKDGLGRLKNFVGDGGVKNVPDPDFSSIKKYLELNPPIEGSLSVRVQTPAFEVRTKR